MYARVIQFTMGPGTQSTGEALREQFSQALKVRKGLNRVYFFGDHETGKYFTVALWETKEDGEATFQELQPQLQEALKGLVEAPPQSDYFEVFEVVDPEN